MNFELILFLISVRSENLLANLKKLLLRNSYQQVSKKIQIIHEKIINI